MKQITIATKINRNFYRSLRKRGRSHYDIMRMIQPDRYDQFLNDIQPIIKPLKKKPVPKTPWWKKILS